MYTLITGGNGYIGTNIISQYKTKSFAISDYSDISTAAQDYNNLFNVKAVIHLAALSGIAACENDPVTAIRDNILSADNIFKLSVQYKVPVVFTSSQAAKNPKSSVYAMMKWTVENLAKMYNEKGGKIYVVRLANVYGGVSYLEKKQTCIKQFITRYNNNEPLEVHGEGTQERDFIHVWDVCDALMRIITIQPDDKRPIDIGTGIGTTISDVTRMFPRRQNQHYKLVQDRDAGANSSIADTEKAERLLNFKAERKLEDYIKESII